MKAVGMYRGSIFLFVLLSGAFDYAKLFCDSLGWSRSQTGSGGRLLGTAFLSGFASRLLRVTVYLLDSV